MKKNAVYTIITAALVLALLMTMLSGCGRKNSAAETAAPAPTAAPAGTAEPAGSAEAVIETGRQDGERFEDVIVIEGMEEPVRYEHVRNDAIGFEMDYDYERFERRSELNRECFVSVYDLPNAPENYLEVTYRAEDADTVAASFTEALSREYDLLTGTRELDRAGSCIRIEASVLKDTDRMADQLQVVYIIPAGDGCRVAIEHFSAESAEGFGRRFSYILNTLAVIDRNAESGLTGTWQTASMAYEADGTMYPEYYVWFTDTDIIYGHVKDGASVFDHSDRITRLEKTAEGGWRVQAEASNGVRYTYQTCETDSSVLEYYETWNETEFPEAYRGGASLSRIS